jgi:signal transduction histidine kinase
MKVYSATLLLSAGVCLGFALNALMLLWQSRQRRYAYLLVLSLLEAAYCATAYAYFLETQPLRALPFGQSICVFTPFITCVFADLVMDLTGHGDKRPPWFSAYQRVNVAATSAFALLALSDVWLGTHVVTGNVVTDLASRHRHRLSFTPLGQGWLAWVSVSFIVFAVLLFRGYRVRRHLLPTIIGCGAYFAATISDFGILTDLYDTYFLQHFGFFALVIGCWWVLAERYELSLRELQSVVLTLEEQRRKLLISPPLVHQHKLDGIGALAAGVAHEINNPVHGIMNYAALLKRQVDDPVVGGFAGEILGECVKVTNIVKALLSFSRKDEGQIGGVSVRDIIEDVARLARHALATDGVRLQIEVASDVPEVSEGAQQIRQVLMNLVTNACDALSMREHSRRDEKTVRIVVSVREEGGMLWLIVDTIDNADGIEPVVLDRIFDPFFTTKPPGRGTGLGLAICQELVAVRGGRLTCQTVRGEGSRFQFDLPLGDATRRASAGARPRPFDQRKKADLATD